MEIILGMRTKVSFLFRRWGFRGRKSVNLRIMLESFYLRRRRNKESFRVSRIIRMGNLKIWKINRLTIRNFMGMKINLTVSQLKVPF
jgi:hypothetical protein